MFLLFRRLSSKRSCSYVVKAFHTNAVQCVEQRTVQDICNVTRLPDHLNTENSFEAGQTLSDKRRLFGTLGLASKVDPSLLWPVKREFEELKQYQNQFEPSLEELFTNMRQKQAAEEKALKDREEKVTKAMAKMSDLIAQFHNKRTRRAGEISKVDEKRQALLDEAREYFGYELSPRDPRFLELVERKQEEEKRLKKKMRKEKRVERTVLSLTGQAPSAPGKKTNTDEEPPTATSDAK